MLARKLTAGARVVPLVAARWSLPRCLSDAASPRKAIFFDMIHSNNAARIRLWLRLKENVSDAIETRMVTYPDLQTPEFAAVNYLKKVPALINEDGHSVIESAVILNYLEYKYSLAGHGPSFLPSNPEDRALVELMCRCHDLYVASPNSSMPGFSHSQGAMYLSPYATKFCSAERAIDRPTRASKIAELWKQLQWLDKNIVPNAKFLAGDSVTLADMTWYPTTIFMEFMLPRVFGWPDVFRDTTCLPNVARWWTRLTAEEPEFSRVRDEIYGFWQQKWEEGQFESIIEEVKDKSYQWSYPVRWEGDQRVLLNYQEPPPSGKRTGRYIDQVGDDALVDVHIAHEVTMRDGRQLSPAATLESHGFALAKHPTALAPARFHNNEEVVRTYYEEIRNLVKAQSGASRVFVFDHTVRDTANSNLNATDTGSAAPVPRVHCDYTHDGAPRRLQQLGERGIFSHIKGRTLTAEEVEKLASGRFAFINVWRSIDDENPIMRSPLAVCDEASVPEEDRFLYELHFPNRVGENYSLQFNEKHKWYMYPQMTYDECLVFKVYDKKKDGVRFVFHTAYTDPRGGPRAPPRRSIEVRTIAFFDDA